MDSLFEPIANLLEWLLLEDFAPNAALLVVAVFTPLVVGAVLMVAGRLSDLFVKGLALVGFFVPALIACWLWGAYVDSTGFLFRSDTSLGLGGPWGPFGISLKLGLNGVSLPLFLLASLVGLAAGTYAVQSPADRMRQYLTLLLIMQGGLLGVFASIDIFFFYFFHEVALIPTFILIAVWGGRGRRSAAMEMAVYLTLGAMLSLLGLIAVYVKSGANSFDIITLKRALANTPLDQLVQHHIFGLLLFGFGILVSLWPFHSWAPRAYAAAPTPVAMMHAGVLKKFGLYGLIQIAAPLLPAGAHNWVLLLAVLALGNIILIGLVTVAQRDLKQMVSYSSVMHMGYAFLGIVCLTTVGAGGAVMLMFAHGLSVALLFLLSTCIYHRSQTFDLAEMGGLGRHTPVLATCFVAATFASIGLPGFANFWGELAIFVALWAFEPWLVVPAVLGIVISAVYGLRAAARIFMGEASAPMAEVVEAGGIEDLKAGEGIPAVVLLFALLAVGFFPGLISENIGPALEETYPIAAPGAVTVDPAPTRLDQVAPGAGAADRY